MKRIAIRLSLLMQTLYIYSYIPNFVAVRILIINPMHNLYLGTVKYIFNIMWVKRIVISRFGVNEINQIIKSWSVPLEVRFARLPADMEHSLSFTAEQWMIWVNYYSLICLYGVLPPKHLESWRHFVLASRLLCKRKLSKTELRVADALLLKFCRHFEVSYGLDAITPNIHLHEHLSDCISILAQFLPFGFSHLKDLMEFLEMSQLTTSQLNFSGILGD